MTTSRKNTEHSNFTAFTTDGNATVTQGFLYAPFGEIVSEYNAGFANGIMPKYSFNAKELDEESGMYYYEARYYAPPTFTSRDPMFEQKPWLTPYHYCSNNPTGRVDPTGMFDDEAKANKYHERAVKKYGSERVGDVRQSAESGEYYFNVYGKDEVTSNKDGGLNGGVVTLNSITIKAGNERPVFSKKGYKSLLKRNMRSGEVSPSRSFKAGQSIRNFEDKFVDVSQAVLSGAVLFNPVAGVANDAMVLVTGEDMYGNAATGVDKCVAALDIFTLIGAKAAKYVGSRVAKIMDDGNKATSLYSGATTTVQEYKKR